MLRRQQAIEIVPRGEPFRWRRYDVPQHLAPETSDALRFCAVEGDLELLDRRHQSTLAARATPCAERFVQRGDVWIAVAGPGHMPVGPDQQRRGGRDRPGAGNLPRLR